MQQKFRPHERLGAGELPPAAVAWLHPLELVRTAYHAWLSRVAMSYIDRREVLAALDREFAEPPPFSDAADVWVDFIADVGDSWEATYAMATLLAQRKLKVAGLLETLPHADLVVLGGDLVYPSPTRDSYRRRTCGPIGSALPDLEKKKEGDSVNAIRPRRLVAIPGNHDWYDGLTSFVRQFCQGGWIGGWQLMQRRSYFAVNLMPGWWIFGIDIALDTRIDPAQQMFFVDVLTDRGRFQLHDNVILCTAKPSWLPSSRYSDDAYKNLEFVVRDLIELHGGRVAMILSGDLHHYARYSDADHHQLVTAGGGGAYLMGTHHLPMQVAPDQENKTELDEPGDADEPKGFLSNPFHRSRFTYPSQSDSRRLALGALLLALRRVNIPFCIAVGLIYVWISRMLDRISSGLLDIDNAADRFRAMPEWRLSAVAVISAIVIVGGCAAFCAASNRRASKWLTIPWGALHGVAQIALAILLTLLLVPDTLQRIGGPASPYIDLPQAYDEIARQLSMVADGVVFALIGGWLGATLVGVYLTMSDLLLHLHHNEVFLAQSIYDYRSFLRIRVSPGGGFTIYPIGVRRVPRGWRSRLSDTKSDPHYEPTDGEITPHLIEGPIGVVIKAPDQSAATVARAPVSSSVQTSG
jgi:3',5'-cyclic AMP phosphodiesterase CpdA